MELVLTWRKAVIAVLLAAGGLMVYVRFFRGLSSLGTKELFAEYAGGNPAARHLLKTRRKKHSVRDLEEFVQHEDVKVRVLAVELLGREGAVGALDALAEALGDASWEVRVAAVESLVEVGVKNEVVPLLASMLDDDDPRVLTACTRGLRTVTGDRTVHGIDGWKNWWDMHKGRY